MTIGGLDRNAQQETYPRRCAALADNRLGTKLPLGLAARLFFLRSEAYDPREATNTKKG